MADVRDYLAILTVVGSGLTAAAVVFGYNEARAALVASRPAYDRGEAARLAFLAEHPLDDPRDNDASTAQTLAAKAAFEAASGTPMTTYADGPIMRPLIAEVILSSSLDQFRRYGWMLLGGLALSTVASVASLWV